MERIAVVAGAGQFPYLVAKEAKARGYYVLVCPVIDNATEDFSDVADDIVPIHVAKLQKTITLLHKYSVQCICAAGAVNKAKAFSSLPDFRMAKVIFSSLTKGDDSILRAIMKDIENEGFTVIQPDVFVPFLRVPQGLLTKKALTPELQEQIAFGVPIVQTTGSLDIGQCIVVHKGIVVAVEAMEGTDATLKRAGELCKKNCVAIKIAKPKQDERVDLPSVGKRTIELLIAYSYSALVVECEKTLFFDMEESIALANRYGITIIGIDLKDYSL